MKQTYQISERAFLDGHHLHFSVCLQGFPYDIDKIGTFDTRAQADKYLLEKYLITPTTETTKSVENEKTGFMFREWVYGSRRLNDEQLDAWEKMDIEKHGDFHVQKESAT